MYDVKYVIGGREKNVPERWIHFSLEETKGTAGGGREKNVPEETKGTAGGGPEDTTKERQPAVVHTYPYPPTKP